MKGETLLRKQEHIHFLPSSCFLQSTLYVVSLLWVPVGVKVVNSLEDHLLSKLLARSLLQSIHSQLFIISESRFKWENLGITCRNMARRLLEDEASENQAKGPRPK